MQRQCKPALAPSEQKLRLPCKRDARPMQTRCKTHDINNAWGLCPVVRGSKIRGKRESRASSIKSTPRKKKKRTKVFSSSRKIPKYPPTTTPRLYKEADVNPGPYLRRLYMSLAVELSMTTQSQGVRATTPQCERCNALGRQPSKRGSWIVKQVCD